MSWTRRPGTIACPPTSLTGLPSGNITIWIGDGSNLLHFIFPLNGGRWAISSRLYPHIGTMTAAGYAVNGEPVWTDGNTAILYSSGANWIYMPDCPYPGYPPTVDDVYYTVAMLADLAASISAEITFTAAGSATGDLTMTLDWEELWTSTTLGGEYTSELDPTQYVGYKCWEYGSNGYYIGENNFSYTDGDLRLQYSDHVWTLTDSQGDRWETSSDPVAGSDWEFTSASEDPQDNITLTWFGWLLTLPEGSATEVYTGDIPTWL